MAEGGLILVVKRVQQIASAFSLAATAIREAADERKTYNAELRETERIESTSSVSRAKGGTTGTMGSSHDSGSGGSGMPKAVTASGLAAALAVTRGRR